MGCDEHPKIMENNRIINEDDYMDIQSNTTKEIIDEKIIQFFSSNNNKDKLNVFLLSKNTILNYNINQLEMPNKLGNIEIYYEYEKCDEISKRDDFENEFFIVSEDFMREIYQDFNKIKDKSVTINKQANNYNIVFQNSSNLIQFKSKENGFFAFYYAENDFNPKSYPVEENFFYYKIKN